MEKIKEIYPRLRFKEFGTAWKVARLGELLSFKNGVNASKEQYGRGIKFINVLDILNNNFITHDKILGSVDIDENMLSKNEVKYGDVLFQRSSETRKDVGFANVYIDKTCTATFGGFVIRGQRIADYDPIFMNFLLRTDISRKEITSKSGGSTRYNVGQETLKTVSVFLPELQEQKKIGEFLFEITKRTELLISKRLLLKKYKKGVMQKLFNQTLRFTDERGKKYPDWKEKVLGKIVKIVVGGTPSTSNEDYWEGNIGWLTSGELNNGTLINSVKSITQLGLKKSSAKLMPPDTVLLAMTGATLGKTGLLKFECSGNQSIAGFLPSEHHIPAFLFYLLQQKKNTIISFSGGAAQAGINKRSMENLRFKFPSLPEQEKIADFLTAIDDKISLVEQQIEKTEAYKKGLLQQMFV